MSEYLAMGGYAAFIWSAYGISVVVLSGLTIFGFRRLDRLQSALREFDSERGRS